MQTVVFVMHSQRGFPWAALVSLSLHFHSLKGRFSGGIPEVADFSAPG
jgi:hypothetical protein